MASLERLMNFGFVKIGKWSLNPKNPNAIVPNIATECANERVIYAFVVEDSVRYIGIVKSLKRTLKARLNEYRTPDTRGKGSTNREVGRTIRDLLKTKRVDIYGLKPDSGIPEYRGLHIDLVSGLEGPLIEEFRLQDEGWNKTT